MNKKDMAITVAIECLVYNHKPYLRQCLDGFVMQKTNFRFVAIVHDDCSTDGSQEIIREYEEKYPDIIRPIYEVENQYSKRDGKLMRIVNEALNATEAKYLAFCEGDDCWIDPLKLQKQVDYLNANKRCGLVYSCIDVIDEHSNVIAHNGKAHECNFDSLFDDNGIPTLTVCMRMELNQRYFNNVTINHNWLMGDLPRWIYVAHESDLYMMPEITAFYRILLNSASGRISINSRENFLLSNIKICEYFVSFFGCKDKLRRIHIRCIDTLLNLSLNYNQKTITNPWVKMYEYNIFSFRLILKTFMASSCIGRKIYNYLSE
ncbi:glycosyltransferase [Prevotella nigrescens]|uniref:glycosyltransferase n=1 Tax=Prevotella nigrescens TaxID=28133 RepID=UPI0002AE9085|nr:glycosyltransferase [Prevotella nigrescens]ELX67989.1 hypothetical protein HMPREF0662_00736 [Prevotella nigrescens F0103]QUB53169.1 glycosyltransferase [Prevotella nigrescens F0103]